MITFYDTTESQWRSLMRYKGRSYIGLGDTQIAARRDCMRLAWAYFGVVA